MQNLGSRFAAGLLAAALFAGPVVAQDLEKVIGYRQGLMKVNGWHAGAIAAMAKGEVAFDNAALAHHADALAAMAKLVLEGFPPGSVGVANSKAKAEIDAERAEFEEYVETLEKVTADFAAAAPAMTAEQLAEALGKVGGACKECHDEFRSK